MAATTTPSEFEDMMLDLAWKNYQEMGQWSRDIDTKAQIVASTAGILLGLSATILSPKSVEQARWLLVGVNGALFLSLLLAIAAFMVRKHHILDTRRALETLGIDQAGAKRTLVATLSGFEIENRRSNYTKVRWLKGSIWALLASLLLLAIASVYLFP